MSTSSRNQSKELKDLTIDDFPEMKNAQERKMEQKMEFLQKNLNNPQLSQYHENLKAALDLYKAGKCPTSQNPWVLQNGRLLGRWPTPEDRKNVTIYIEVLLLFIIMARLLRWLVGRLASIRTNRSSCSSKYLQCSSAGIT